MKQVFVGFAPFEVDSLVRINLQGDQAACSLSKRYKLDTFIDIFIVLFQFSAAFFALSLSHPVKFKLISILKCVTLNLHLNSDYHMCTQFRTI